MTFADCVSPYPFFPSSFCPGDRKGVHSQGARDATQKLWLFLEMAWSVGSKLPPGFCSCRWCDQARSER